MSLTRSLAHNSAIQIISKVISVALGIAVIPIMIQSLGATEYGWYVTAASFLQFIGVLSDFGFTVTVSNMLAEPHYDKQTILNTSFTWRFITAFILNGLAPILILFFPYPAPVKIAVAILSLSFFAIYLNQIFIAYYREALRMWVASLAEVGARIILFAGIWLAAARGWGFLPMMTVITIASVAAAAYQWLSIGNVKFTLDRAVSKYLFQKIWPTAVSVICNAVYLQADRVILPLFASAAVVGFYGTAYRVLDIIIQVAALLMGLVMPLITHSWSRGDGVTFKKRYQMGFDLLVLVLLPMTVGVAMTAPQIMQFVKVPDYMLAGKMLAWLSLSIFGTCFGMIFGHIALAINKQKETLWIYGSDAILSLIGYLIFIPRYSWAGAVGVTLFSELYAGVLLTLSTIRYSQTYPELKNFLKVTLASLIMAAALYYISPTNLLTSMLVGAVVYGACIILLKVITPTTLKEIISRRRELPVVEQQEI